MACKGSVDTIKLDGCNAVIVNYDISPATPHLNATIISNDELRIVVDDDAGAAGTYWITLYGDFCAEPFKYVVQTPPPDIDTIAGEIDVCPGIPYTYMAESHPVPNTTYEWSIVGGSVSPASGSQVVTVVWDNMAMVRELSVNRVNTEMPFCPGNPFTLGVIVTPTAVNITGLDTVCANSYTKYESNFELGDYYDWLVEDLTLGSIAGANGNHNVNIMWKDVTVQSTTRIFLEVRRCDSIVYDTFTVVINPSAEPEFLVAPSTACPGYEYFEVTPGGTSYQWEVVQSAFSQNTGSVNSCNIIFPKNNTAAPIIYTVKVTVSGGLGTSPCPPNGVVTWDIEILPSPDANASVDGPIKLCLGQSMSTNLIGTHTTNAPAPYTYTWLRDSAYYAGTQNTTTSVPGNFNFVVEADNGCKDTSNTVVITEDSCKIYSNNCNITPPAAWITGNPNPDCGENPYQLYISNNSGNYSLEFSTAPAWVNGLEIGFNKPGIYDIYYTEHWGPDTCDGEDTWQITVYMIPDYKPLIECGTGNDYLVTLQDFTAYAAGHTIDDAEWDIYDNTNSVLVATGLLASNFPISLEAGNSYTITQYVSVDNHSINCTKEYLLQLPEKTAIQMILIDSMPDVCEHYSLAFDVIVTPASTTSISYYWEFLPSEGASKLKNPHSEFEYDVNNPTPLIHLTVIDQFGCILEADTIINIYPNDLDIDLINADTVCSDEIVTLGVDVLSGNPLLYQWSWHTEHQYTLADYYDVHRSGMYWVVVHDMYACRRMSNNQESVIIISVPIPEIKGKTNYCEDETVILSAGLGTGVSYEWFRNSAPIGTNNPFVIDEGLPPGTYEYELMITVNDSITGYQCNRSSTKTVYIHPTPADPYIDNVQIIDCPAYEIEITAAHPDPGTFNWSTGGFGPDITVYAGGAYRVWFTDLNGCSSYTDAVIPPAPEMYEAYFPKGCYPTCDNQRNDLNLYLPPSAWFVYWAWLLNGNIDASGNNSPVAEYAVTQVGEYQLVLENDYCTDTLGVMSITDTTCIDCIDVFADVTGGALPNIDFECNTAIPGRYYAYISITNSYTANATYFLSSDLGPVFPSVGTVAATTNIMPILEFNSMQLPVPDTIRVRILMLYDDGKRCYHYVDVPIDSCNFDEQRGEAPPQEDPKMPTAQPELLVYPNPAADKVTIAYSYTGSALLSKCMSIYDVHGRKIAEYRPKEKQGMWQLPLAPWTNGIYLVRMEENGQTIQTQRLVISK